MSTEDRSSTVAQTQQTPRYRVDLAMLDWLERRSDTQFVYMMLVPVFALLGTMAIWPLLYTANISLHADSIATADPLGEFIVLQNYVDILAGEAHLQRPFFSLSNPFTSAAPVTLLYTGSVIAIETVLGLSMALILNKEFRGRRWVRVAMILPWAVPIVIQGMIFYLMFQPSIGFAVDPLSELGIISSTPLANSRDGLLIAIIADVWKQSAFMALLILAGLQSIDRNLYDVAEVAGASKLQQFRTITFPLVLPALLVALLFRTIDALKVYGLIEATAGCNTVPTLSCLVIDLWNGHRYGSAAAVAFIIATVIGVLLIGYLVQLRKQETGGQ
ncbi:carbohydrate ABC transporter permease [Natrialba asiatica]|uniref:Sugar ABC transporter permease n=1 Tax=Natrialba asiatica (strain ATCC 700177 / DSM 12278 / JCM 9576 / FERM P-10747 / NBRC 102637 / 172P1) TaxID=29540 RepID=M0B505_NATA1|nr:sugar ABC transporter permease [Natrialba asiatica]ELZ05981.1 sugar ABC transporter permease [Natrialba asiatica DSM 12278]